MADYQRQFLAFVHDFDAVEDPDALFAALKADETVLPYDACDSLYLTHGSTFADGVKVLTQMWDLFPDDLIRDCADDLVRKRAERN